MCPNSKLSIEKKWVHFYIMRFYFSNKVVLILFSINRLKVKENEEILTVYPQNTAVLILNTELAVILMLKT